MKTTRVALTLGVAAALLLSGCSGGSSGNASGSEDTLTVALADTLDSWNPQAAVASTSFSVFPQIFASLLSTSPDGSEIEPGLALSYEFDPTGLALTFELDPEAKFSDGTPVTAADVVFSSDLWRAGEIYGNYFASVASVEATDEHTVKFALTSPDSNLLGILTTANASIVPKDFGGASEEEFWKRPISAGAYMIADEKVGESITLDVNEHYAKNADRPEHVKYKIVPDAAQQLLQFQSGEVDVVNTVDLPGASQYDQSLLSAAPSSGVSVLMIQTAVAPFDNPDFRHAISLAIDTKELLAGGYVGLADEATSLLPQEVPGVVPCDECDWSDFNLAEAKRIVEASGYDGRQLTITAASGPGPDQLAAQALVPMLEAAGLKVTVEQTPLNTFVEKLGSGSFDLGVVNYNAASPSVTDPLGFVASTGVLFSQADPTAANDALAALQQASTIEQTEAAVQSFEAWAFEASPVIPLSVPHAVYAVSSRTQGFVANPYRTWRAENLTIKG